MYPAQGMVRAAAEAARQHQPRSALSGKKRQALSASNVSGDGWREQPEEAAAEWACFEYDEEMQRLSNGASRTAAVAAVAELQVILGLGYKLALVKLCRSRRSGTVNDCSNVL